MARALEDGDALYFTLDASPLKGELSRFYSALENALARSERSCRDSAQSVLTVFKLMVKLSGADEAVRFGASSRSLGEAGFSNRIAVAASPGCSGWLWHCGGAAEDRFSRLGKLPENTVAAADFGIDFSPALRELESSGAGEVLKNPSKELLGMSVRELLLSLSGDWRFAFTASPGTGDSGNAKFGFFISLPDRDGLIFRRISACISVFVPGAGRNGDSVYLPGDGVTAPVLTAEPGRLTLYSSPEFLSELRECGGTLDKTPEFRAAAERLSKRVNGAFYLSDRGFEQCVRLGAPEGVISGMAGPGGREAGVWKTGDGLIEVDSISSAPMQQQFLRDLALIPLAFACDRALRAPAVPAIKATVKAKKSPASEAELERCRKRLADIWKRLSAYRTEHGEFPAGFGAAALKKALPGIPPCGKTDYLYFGSFGKGSSPKLPLVADAPAAAAHPGAVNVLLADGTVRTVRLENCSMKRLCSYLHTVYRYDEKVFVKLIGRASQLDAKGK